MFFFSTQMYNKTIFEDVFVLVHNIYAILLDNIALGGKTQVI